MDNLGLEIVKIISKTNKRKIPVLQTGDCQGEEVGRGMEWEVEASRYKLLCTGWMNNKVLLRSTGKYIQYSVISHNGKE